MNLEALTKAGWVCLDATRATETVARLLNHRSSREGTARPFKALLVKGHWRVEFITTRHLVAGEELAWDYGASPEGQTWLMRRSHPHPPQLHHLQPPELHQLHHLQPPQLNQLQPPQPHNHHHLFLVMTTWD